MRSVFYKLFSSYVLMIAGVSALLAVVWLTELKSFYVASRTEDLSKLTVVVSRLATPYFQSEGTSRLDQFIKSIGAEIVTRLTVVDASGVVLADSINNPKTMENHAKRPEIYGALNGRPASSIRYSDTERQEMLYYAVPVQINGKTAGVVRTSLFIKDIDASIAKARGYAVRVIVIMIIIALLAAYALTRGFTGPVKELQKASALVASGNFTARVHMRQRDEFQELAKSFNTMTGQLQGLFAEVTAQKEALKAIVTSIREGLLVVREDGNVMLCNDAARAAVGVDLKEGEPYWETLRNPAIGAMIKNCIAAKQPALGEAEIDNKQFLVSTAYSATRREVVVVMFDVTSIKSLEIMKKELVTNASHELMTPLTAIRGFIETMRDATKEEAAQYLDIIDKHTERLTRIVYDLLTLSKMEEKGFLMESLPVNLTKLLPTVTGLMEGRAKDKRLALTVQFPEEQLLVSGDVFRLEQIFINLIDNAIKYTDNGKIDVALSREGSGAVIRVCDTGIGIPRQLVERVFERFFVVDKSRSRQSGGTGLGLAIVKHAVLMHNGSIDVKQQPGGGTCFTVTLPLLPQ